MRSARYLAALLLPLAFAGAHSPFTLAACAQELPSAAKPGEMEAAAKSLLDDLPNLPALPESGVGATLGAQAGNAVTLSVDQAQAKLDRAVRKQDRWDKLARGGVLSKVEAERAIIDTAEARATLERAKLADAQSRLDSLQDLVAASAVEPAPERLTLVASLEQAKQRVADAEMALKKTRLELAERNLQRHRQLLAEKMESRAQCERAAALVEKLRADLAASPPAATP